MEPTKTTASDSYSTGTVRVEIRAGEDGVALDAEVRLISTTPSGQPLVRSTRTYQGDAAWSDLPAGAHRVEVEARGRFSSSIEIALLQGETRDVRIELERSRAVTLAFDPADRVIAELLRFVEYTDSSGERRVAGRAKTKVFTNLAEEGCAVDFEPIPNSDVVFHVGGLDLPTGSKLRLGLVEVPRLVAYSTTSLSVSGFDSSVRARSAQLEIAREDPTDSVRLETRTAADGSSITAEFRAPPGPCLLRVTMGDGARESYLLPITIGENQRELRVEIP